MSELPEPSFIDRDPAEVLRELVERYESDTGRTLTPAQLEQQLIDLIAYRENLLRIAIQDAAKQNLVAYARFPMIDHLAALVGVTRLPAQPARTTLQWTLPAALGVPSVVPSGTRVRTKDGRIIFATDADLLIAAGATVGTIPATATTSGPLGNGYLAGQVTELVDPVGFDVAVTNQAETSGGSAAEDSDRLRARIPLAVRSFSVAGPADAYRFWALSAHPDVLDATVGNPSPGLVRIAVMARAGAPSSELLAAVLAAVSAPSVRPICDTVEVAAATSVACTFSVTAVLRRGVDVAATMASITAAAEAYQADREGGLGRSFVRTQLIAACSVAGVYSLATSIIGPSGETDVVEVAADQYVDATLDAVTFGSFAEGD